MASKTNAVRLVEQAHIPCREEFYEFDENDLFDPHTNIRFGTFYLKYLLDKFGDTDTALACYNAGEGNARAWFDNTNTIDIAQISFSETVHYIDKVNTAQKAYRARLRFVG